METTNIGLCATNPRSNEGSVCFANGTMMNKWGNYLLLASLTRIEKKYWGTENIAPEFSVCVAIRVRRPVNSSMKQVSGTQR